MRNIVLLFYICAVTSCDLSTSSQSDYITSKAATENCTISNYGENVLYFSCNEDEFGNALRQYLGAHPTQEVSAVSGNGGGSYGRDTGYWIVVKEKCQ